MDAKYVAMLRDRELHAKSLASLNGEHLPDPYSEVWRRKAADWRALRDHLEFVERELRASTELLRAAKNFIRRDYRGPRNDIENQIAANEAALGKETP